MLVSSPPSPHPEQRFYTRYDQPQITLPFSDRTTTITLGPSSVLCSLKSNAWLIYYHLAFYLNILNLTVLYPFHPLR